VGTLGIFQLAACLIGLLFGSFLNVCISRLPQHESIVHPRSRCPQCGAAIRWYDNIPILSWIILRARCQECKGSISWRYPAVETALGLWFLRLSSGIWLAFFPDLPQNTVASFQFSTPIIIEAVSLAILAFLLIGLLVMDWQTHLLPNAFTITGIAIAALFVCAKAAFLGPTEDQIVLNTTHQLRLSSPGSAMAHGNVFLTGAEAVIFGRLLAIFSAAAILLTVRWLYKALRHREGLGMGDVKLLAMIAAFLGFWPAILALFIGVLSASAYALLLLARGKAGLASKLPLGTFLAIGGLISAQFGSGLINMYAALLQ